MPKNPPLTDFEKGQIKAYAKENKSLNFISKPLGRFDSLYYLIFFRSRDVIRKYLKDPVLYNQIKKKSGRPTVVSPSAKRLMLREASKGKSTSKELKSNLNFSFSDRTVRRHLQNSKNLIYTKRLGAPNLTDAHKKKQSRLGQRKGYLKDKR